MGRWPAPQPGGSGAETNAFPTPRTRAALWPLRRTVFDSLTGEHPLIPQGIRRRTLTATNECPAAGPWPGLTVAPSRDIRRAILDTVLVTHEVPNPDMEATRK